MAIRQYICPIETRREQNSDGSLGLFIRAPWIFLDRGIRPHRCMDYGPMVILEADTTVAQHNQLIAQSGVYGFPIAEGGAVDAPAVRTRLEASGFPGDLIEASHTVRGAIFRIRAMCRFRQCLRGRGAVELDEVPPLGTLVREWPAERRAVLEELAGRTIAGSETIRSVFLDIVRSRFLDGAPA
jgi:hypothetical protein